MKKISAIFKNIDKAEDAVISLNKNKIKSNNISIVVADDRWKDYISRPKNMIQKPESIAIGSAVGAIFGAIVVSLIGLVAAGLAGSQSVIGFWQLTLLITGAATGGLIGAFAGNTVEHRVPNKEDKFIKNNLKSGRILVGVKTNPNKLSVAKNILQSYEPERLIKQS